MSKYDEEARKQKELTKKLAVEELKSWIKQMSLKERDQPTIVVATKTFTPNELLKEIEGDTEHGREIVHMLSRLRVELSKKKGE